MKLYAGKRFDYFAEEIRNKITTEINAQTDAYILNVNVDDYTSHLVQKFAINTPELHFDKVFVDSTEIDVKGRQFPRYDFMITDENKTFRKEMIVYHLPYSGDINLLQLQPNPMSLMTAEAKVDERQKCLLIGIINFYNDAERIKQQYNQELSYIGSNYHNIRNNCETFNDGLPYSMKHTIEFRRQQILQRNNLMTSLGVPIKKKDGVAESFSIPNPKLKEKIIVKPVVLDKDFKPEPTLDENNYRKILKIINDVGKNFERLPSTYKGKSEEDIRDHILLILDPNFEYGSAGGETFNKIGKTDISLRYDSSVVFIAECKYWKGEKGFLKTIDQLLGYLTWRNSKVAIINFVQNNEFTEVLDKLKNSIKDHQNFLKELPASDETWFNYKFHLNGDRNRELDIAIISFHLPK